MAKKTYLLEDALRFKLTDRMEGKKQIQVAGEIGIHPANLSAVLRGAPLPTKVIEWLGFRKVEGLYERID